MDMNIGTNYQFFAAFDVEKNAYNEENQAAAFRNAPLEDVRNDDDGSAEIAYCRNRRSLRAHGRKGQLRNS